MLFKIGDCQTNVFLNIKVNNKTYNYLSYLVDIKCECLPFICFIMRIIDKICSQW